MFELLLLSVIVSTAYLGPVILRRLGPGQRVYGIMLLADLALALLAFAGRRVDGAGTMSDTVGAIAIGAGFCLVMLPPILRDLGRRLMARDQLRLALLACELRELLQPGMGARPEGELIATVLAVREGREQEIVDALALRRDAAEDPRARRHFDERIAMTYLYAQRWPEAVAHYEKRIDPQSAGAGSPQLSVEMVRAYCESEKMDAAAELMERIEASPLATEPQLLSLVARARMVFLAFAGRTSAVEMIVGAEGPLSHMPEAARSFWLGITRAQAGDVAGARSALQNAVTLSGNDPRAKQVAEQRLSRLDEAPPSSRPHLLPALAAELADRLTGVARDMCRASRLGETPAGRRLPQLGSIAWRLMPVTVALVVANLGASLIVYVSYGDFTDLGALIAAGANLKSATASGEWWRLVTSMFLHVGIAHLLLNAYGLWILGRLVEQMHGSVRMLAIYGISGIIGALASTFLGAAGTAVGASGAVMGLMGAALAELGIYRARYPRRWVRPLFGMLTVLTVAQVAIGFFYPIVDQWGHVGGLLGGALMGTLVSPHGVVLRRLRYILAIAAAIASLAFFIYGAVIGATTSYTKTLRNYPKEARQVGGLRLEAPGSWVQISSRELYDPGIAAVFDMQRLPAELGLDAALAARLKAERQGGAQQAGFDTAKPAARSEMKLPSPWRGGELMVTVDDGSGTQRYRLVVFARLVDQEIWLGGYYHPAALTKAIEPIFAEILHSVHAAPQSSL